jgi:signal transduction histidine kinase
MLIEESCQVPPSTSLSDLQKIHGAGKDLLHLINDILDIAEIESGEMKAHLEKFELPKMIRDVTSSLQPLVEKNKNRLEVEIQAGVGEVQSDPTKLRRILSNLIGNACKFTERGSIKLSIDIADNTGSKYLKFTISDNGRGIAPEMKAFTQADQSPIRQGVGTALGLTITHHFCRMLGGDITVKSTLGEGSTFIVTLPCNTPTF